LSCRCQANIDIHLRLCALTEHTTSRLSSHRGRSELSLSLWLLCIIEE
jgi:hypothetical protein